MTVCVAYGCSNRSERKPPNVTFHSFPKDPEVRRAWIIAVRRANWMPSIRSMLCSEHFTEEMFDRSSTMMVRLRKGAVPSIFKGFPKELQEKLSKQKPPKLIVSKSKSVPKETDIVPKDINPPKYLRSDLNNALTKAYVNRYEKKEPRHFDFDMSLEIKRQIAVRALRKREDETKLRCLLDREQKYLKKIKRLNEMTAQQEKQIENMQEIISNLKKDHYKKFEERQNFVLFTKKQAS